MAIMAFASGIKLSHTVFGVSRWNASERKNIENFSNTEQNAITSSQILAFSSNKSFNISCHCSADDRKKQKSSFFYSASNAYRVYSKLGFNSVQCRHI